jgi:DNA-binding HxlR family transcriptional regulator
VRRRIAASSVTRVLDLIGDRSTLRVLQHAFAGAARFDRLQDRTGIARNTLANRLDTLVESRVLARKLYQTNPPRHEYLLTERGGDLHRVLLHIDAWERRWSGEMAGPPLYHRACGRPLEARLACGHCRAIVHARDMVYRDPPPAIRGTARRQQRRRARGLHPADGTSLNVADLLGDWWTSMVISLFFFGLRRFNDMEEALGIAPNILSSRLAHLTACGIIDRRAYQDSPPRFEYRLTEKGLALYAMNVAMMIWGDRWLGPRGGVSLVLFHRACNAPLEPLTVCSACGRPVQPGEVCGAHGEAWGRAAE